MKPVQGRRGQHADSDLYELTVASKDRVLFSSSPISFYPWMSVYKHNHTSPDEDLLQLNASQTWPSPSSFHQRVLCLSSAEQLKGIANGFLTRNQFVMSALYYSFAIQTDPNNHIFFSNRSVSFLKLGDFQRALSDGERCIEINKEFVKGYSRIGNAYEKMNNVGLAERFYYMGLKVDPDNKNLRDALRRIDNTYGRISEFGSLAQEQAGDILANAEDEYKEIDLTTFVPSESQSRRQMEEISENSDSDMDGPASKVCCVIS